MTSSGTDKATDINAPGTIQPHVIEYIEGRGGAVTPDDDYISVALPSATMLITRAREGRMTLVVTRSSSPDEAGRTFTQTVHAELGYEELIGHIIEEASK